MAKQLIKKEGKHIVIIDGIRLDKRYFRASFILLVGLGLLGWGLDGFFNPMHPPVHIKCPTNLNQPCYNPVYHVEYEGLPSWLTNQEILEPGFEYGSDMNWIFKNFELIFIIIIGGGFVINGLVNNKRVVS